MNDSRTFRCKLCGEFFPDAEMSEEHYPARSVGNNDIVSLDIVKLMDSLLSTDVRDSIINRFSNGEVIDSIVDDMFDNHLSETLYPTGRTARTLCQHCNHRLGKYDEAYLKFFSCGGDPKQIKGFGQKTKLRIIKSIYGKFLSVPETNNEEFDFLKFIEDESLTEYSGTWRIYFVKRNYSCDLMGFCDIGTGKVDFEEGVVYEFSDNKFIFNLMNFEKHSSFVMNNIFDILDKKYTLVEGVGKNSYHSQILMGRLFKHML